MPTIPQTVGGRQSSNTLVAIPIRQSRAPTEVPGDNQEIVTASAITTAATIAATTVATTAAIGDGEGLSEEELVALITHYRGNDQGLRGQSRVRLLVLLQFYEVSSRQLLMNSC